MGISVSMAAGILFVTAIISFGIVWDAEDSKDRKVEEARQDYFQRNRELLDTLVSFINTTYNTSQNEMWINANNNGSTVIILDFVDIYIDGNYSSNKTYNVSGLSTDVWTPQETVNITIGDILFLPTRVKLSCSNGISAYTTSIIQN